MKIRDAVAGDAAGLAQVHVDTWRSAYAGIMPDEVLANLSLAASTVRWLKWLEEAQPGQFAFAAEGEAGELLGYCIGGRERDADPEYDGEVYAIYVLPAAQGQGAGRALMQAAARRLRAQGFRSLLVWVLADNRPARGFYETLGGRPVRARVKEIGGFPMPEAGYGWDGLEELAGESSG